jgi:energy-coupling factor transporter ATP-binding protein EcfA2
MTPESKTLKYILSHLEEVDKFEGMSPEEAETRKSVEPLPCESFEELCERFHETKYLMSETTKQAFAVILAVILSTRFKSGDPVWVHCVGASGGGKTTLIMAAAGLLDHTYFLSKFTGIHSGMKVKGSKDPSLVEHIQDRTLIIKDFTTVLTLPETTKSTVYSELRDFFDGESSSFYRNGEGSKEYKNVRFSVISCVTQAVRLDNYTSLGERFLQVELLDKDHSRQKQIGVTTTAANAGLDAEGGDGVYVDVATPRKQYTTGFLLSKMKQLDDNNNTLPNLPIEYCDRITAIADVVSYLRSKVEREGKNQALAFRPEPEIGARIANQMVKLARCLGVILGKDECDEQVYRIIRKVALDTANSYTTEIALTLLGKRGGLTEKELSNVLKVHPSTIRRRIQDMRELGIVFVKKRSNGQPQGRDVHIFVLASHIRKLMRKAKF